MASKKISVLLVGLLVAISVFVCIPATAEEDQPVVLRSMIQTMANEGLNEDTAKRIAENNRFMVQMCVDRLEQDQLQNELKDKTQDRLQVREEIEERVGSAFGRAMAASYKQQGEEKTFQAGMAMFSAVRRGLSPEGAATSVEVLAENDYEVEKMYRVMMRLTEEKRNFANCDEECLMTRLRTMARDRLSLTEMEKGLAQQARSGDDKVQSGAKGTGSQTGQDQGQKGSEGNGGKSGESDGGGGHSGNRGHGKGK